MNLTLYTADMVAPELVEHLKPKDLETLLIDPTETRWLLLVMSLLVGWLLRSALVMLVEETPTVAILAFSIHLQFPKF